VKAQALAQGRSENNWLLFSAQNLLASEHKLQIIVPYAQN